MALELACGRLTGLQRVRVEAAIEEMVEADLADAALILRFGEQLVLERLQK